MESRARWSSRLLVLALAAGAATPALADPATLDKARRLLNEANPKQAYMELIKLEPRLAGDIEFDYLLGVASLDSGKHEDAVIAFERVLALNPNHAGAQMDLARTFFATGSYDLAESAFRDLAGRNPPPAAQQTINRYLEAIDARKRQTTAGWRGWAELGMGYDTNITGVPGDFGAAAQQSFGIVGIEATGNSVKRKAAFGSAAGSLEYSHPLSRGWTLFAAGDARLRGYDGESNYNSAGVDVRAGGALNDGPAQWRVMAAYGAFDQEGEAPGEPKPTNDRRTANVQGDWKYSLDPRTQVGVGLQYARVRFPENDVEDFNQVYANASLLRSFEAKGAPLLYLTAFASDDRAVNKLPDGETDKSKNLAGVRSYLQYSLTPRLSLFNGLGFVFRRDKDEFARATTVDKGEDKFTEFALGLNWQFRKACAVRAQYSFTRNDSNISIYDFNRSEVSTAVRCEIN
ncbi:MAG: tetratricopeptide repeat protein [Burkholderiales bacterium]